MKFPIIKFSLASLLLLQYAGSVSANNEVSFSKTGNKICVNSNGVPNHPIGTFPNSGNPNSFKTQNTKVCFPANPVKNSTAKNQRGSIGVGLNGIIIRPGTADWYDASSKRGHSRDRSSGWNLEGMGAKQTLGIDNAYGHVDNTGLYHYHGTSSSGLLSSKKDSLVAYAADGFEIHYVGDLVKSGWALKSGTRPTAPGGAHDGTYIQDYVYVGGSNTLDECNGGTLNGKFVYFATNSYPFFPRCLWGDADSSFGNGANRGGGREMRRERPRHGHHKGQRPQRRP